MHAVTPKWTCHNNLRTVYFDLSDLCPYLLFSLCGNAILFCDSSPYTISFCGFTLIVSSFVSLCIHHPSSSPVIAHFNHPFIPQYSPHLATTACTCILPVFKYYFILHIITSPSPTPINLAPSVPVAIFFLGPCRLPKHLFKYIISGILFHLYILPLFPSLLAYILHRHQLSSRTYHPLPEPDGHHYYPSRHMFVFYINHRSVSAKFQFLQIYRSVTLKDQVLRSPTRHPDS